jgi:hypothetical protein
MANPNRQESGKKPARNSPSHAVSRIGAAGGIIRIAIIDSSDHM